MKQVLIVLAMIATIALVAGCLGQATKNIQAVSIITNQAPVYVSAEIADTAEAQMQGLMNKTSLAENEGMLFAFENEAPREFWMKDTLIPLDIFFINASRKIVDIQTMTPCISDSCHVYRSAYPAKWALEVNAGFATKNGIEVGNAVEISVQR